MFYWFDKSTKRKNGHVKNDHLSIGYLAKQKADKMLHEGDISAHQHSTFFIAAKEFLTRCTEYLLQWCPFEEELLVHATWLHFENHLETTFLSVDYFVHRFFSHSSRCQHGTAE